MKRLLILLMCALSQSSQGATEIHNFSSEWTATGPGQGWSCQWAVWDQNNPSSFVDLVWDAANSRMVKADQPSHFTSATAFSAQPNLKLIVGWQAPKTGTVSFVGQGSNWVTQAVYQIIDKNGTVLTSSTVNPSSFGYVSVENVSVAAGDRLYFAYRPNSGSSYSWFEGWPIKIEATFTPKNYRTSTVTIPFENFEGTFDWEILEGFEAGVTLSKQSDVKFEGTSAMNWHFVRQAMQDPWTRAGKMFSTTPRDWSDYSQVVLKFKSNSTAAAGKTIFWDFYQGDARVNGNSGCGTFAVPADTKWNTITLDLADFPRDNVTNLEFYTSNDDFAVGTYDFYFDDIQLAIAVIPGDANNDGMVDVGDLGILAANYGGTDKTWFQGDFNADGSVDVGDLGILAANYGTAEESRMAAPTAGDFSADWVKAMGETVADEESAADTSSSICSGLGLPLIAGMLLAGMLLLGISKLEE